MRYKHYYCHDGTSSRRVVLPATVSIRQIPNSGHQLGWRPVLPSRTVFYISNGRLFNYNILTVFFVFSSDVLAEGGNAVDAAIAALFANCVVNPQSAGLGGGFHMTIYDPASKSARCLDARETAPLAATENMFQNDLSLSKKGFKKLNSELIIGRNYNLYFFCAGGLAVAVPGELAGYWAAHRAYGRLPWSRLIEPAVTMAHNGVDVNRHLAETLGRDAGSIQAEPSMR